MAGPEDAGYRQLPGDVWRRIPPLHFHPPELPQRPASAAFVNDKDGDPMSVVLADVATALGITPADILFGHDGFALVAIRAETLAAHGLIAVPSPRLGEPSHGSIDMPVSKKVRRAVANAAIWVVPPASPLPD
jgi:hypothetical protein